MIRLILCMIGAMVAIFGLAPMAALTADRNTQSKIGDIAIYPVNALSQIYKGSIVCVDDTGNLVPAADTADFQVVGVADENVLGGAADGDTSCRVISGRKFRFPATSITQAMVGDPMFVVDDQTFDDSAGATNDVPIGRLQEFISTTEGWVFIPKGGCRKAGIADATYSANEQTVLNNLVY